MHCKKNHGRTWVFKGGGLFPAIVVERFLDEIGLFVQ